MKVFVVGGSGMLGTDVVGELGRRGFEAISPVTPDDLDITEPVSVADIPQMAEGATWCINCAAYTAVDKAEEERDLACLVNVIGAGYLANACALSGMRMIHISTDFVFDGESKTPYKEEDDTHPIGYYGLTKREGEEAVLGSLANATVVRTAWLYGPNGPSFPRTMIRAWEAGRNLRVVSDQIGCPTYTGDLARILVDMVETSPPAGGIYHAVGPEIMSWHELALRTLRLWEAGKPSPREVQIEPIPTDAYPTPAKRPKYSVLSTEKLQAIGIKPMRPVDEALAEFITRGKAIPGWP